MVPVRVYSQLGTKHDWRIYTVTIQECLNEVTENGGFITVMITVQMSGKVTLRTSHKGPDKDLGLYQVWDVRVRPSVNTQGPNMTQKYTYNSLRFKLFASGQKES